jgi:hypothetical protein
MKNQATKLGFKELAFQDPGINEALNGATVLVFCSNKPAAQIVQRHYYEMFSKLGTNLKKADSLAFYFFRGGKILLLYATKKQSLKDYDRDTTYYRLDWRR